MKDLETGLLEPKEITTCCDTGLEVASFDFYEGINAAQSRKLEQTSDFEDVRAGTHFIVCCGDVMLKVAKDDYPNIERRIF